MIDGLGSWWIFGAWDVANEMTVVCRFVFAKFQKNLNISKILGLQPKTPNDPTETAKVEFQRAQTRTIPT